MVVLIDPPAWPAHGTLWSHLVSDTNLDELHVFARKLGVPRRGFDLDHYDVPAARYAAAVALGAQPVSAKTVVHRLRASGLRVRQFERPVAEPRARRAFLSEDWGRLGAVLCDESHHERWITAGNTLLARWNEPHRHYHDERHLEDVLLACDQLSLRGAPVSEVAHAAAWFHDAVYTGAAGADELASAQFAHHTLAEFGVDVSRRELVAAAIVATIPAGTITPPEPALVLLDADLSIFAASPERYREYAASVRREYAHVPDAVFASTRSTILSTYLAKPQIFYTEQAHELWDQRARSNVTAEVAELHATLPPRHDAA